MPSDARGLCDTFDMQIWHLDMWAGTPVNAVPDGHDAIAWFDDTEVAKGTSCG